MRRNSRDVALNKHLLLLFFPSLSPPPFFGRKGREKRGRSFYSFSSLSFPPFSLNKVSSSPTKTANPGPCFLSPIFSPPSPSSIL